MADIRKLTDDVINKIAAGEVVERPASVVKELVENAIDAGASRITVELEEGGCQSIVVSDDGKGMAPEDARLAVERHATSKLSVADDLFNIATMGFRGEALASISSVSQFCLTTSRGDDVEGALVELNAKGEVQVRPWQGPKGTTITVKKLFHNVPVRCSFLKKPVTELGYVMDFMQAAILANPHIGFRVLHNGKERLHTPALAMDLDRETTLRKRLAQVWDEDLVARLIYVHKEGPYGAMDGLFSTPGDEKGSSRQMYFFVNERWVKDRNLRMALMRGYHSHLLSGQYPIAVLFTRVDPGIVDVNVHPAKAEVRFQYAKDFQDFLAKSIRESLRSGAWAAAEVSRPRFDPTPASFAMPMRTSARETQVRSGVSVSMSTPTRSVSSFSPSSEVPDLFSGSTLGEADILLIQTYQTFVSQALKFIWNDIGTLEMNIAIQELEVSLNDVSLSKELKESLSLSFERILENIMEHQNV